MQIKKILYTLLFGLLAETAYADSQNIGGVWGGLHNSDASILIGDNEAQNLQDVDLTENAFGVKKRAGYAQFRTVGISTHGVRGGYYFRDASGNNVLIHCNERDCSSSVELRAYAAFITTDTSGSYYDWTDSRGRAYRATNNRNEIARYDGTTLTYYPSLPLGNQVEATPDRLIISGTTANPGRIHKSASGDFANFTTGALSADPYTLDIDLTGTEITAIKWLQDRLLFWTRETIGYDSAADQYDLTPIASISNIVGTTQPNSIVEDLGIVYFQGRDKHFYATDGNSIKRISSNIDVSNIVAGEAKRWIQTTNADWNDGTLVNIDSTTSLGEIFIGAIPTQIYDTVFNGNSTPDAASSSWTLTGTPSTATSSGGLFTYGQNSGTSSNYSRGSGTNWANEARTTMTYVIQAEIGNNLCNTTVNGFVIQFNDEAFGNSLRFNGCTEVIGSCDNRLAVSIYTPGGASVADGNVCLDSDSSPTFTINRASDSIRVYANGTQIISTTRTDATTDARKLVFGYLSGGTGIGGPVDVNFFQYITQHATGSFQSQSFNIGTAITDWGPFNINQTLSDGTISYAIYGDTNSAITITNAVTFTSSQTITNGTIPTIATAAYVTWTADFTRTVSTQTPSIQDVTVNWNDGAVTRHFGFVDKDHRIIWSVAEGTATVPNISYIYDTRHDAWLKYSFPMNAAARFSDSFYFGGVSTGVVYQWPSGNTNDGSAITAFFKSKDFVAPLFQEKWYRNISLLTKTQTGSNLDVTYIVNTSSTTIYNISLTDNDGNSFVRSNTKLETGRKGTFFNIQFGNDDADAPFEVYAVGFDYDPLPWEILP